MNDTTTTDTRSENVAAFWRMESAIHTLRRLYADSLDQNPDRELAIDAVWRRVRLGLPRARSTSGSECIARNTSARRSYRSPLGQALGIPGATDEYGQHCARWRRTVSSLQERAAVVEALHAHLVGVAQ